jgi:hypothetical protein
LTIHVILSDLLSSPKQRCQIPTHCWRRRVEIQYQC